MIHRIYVATGQDYRAIAQKSIDLDFDGLMIETHIDPDNAWSDAKQQITPERLSEMLGRIDLAY